MTPSIKPSSNWFALQKSLVQHSRPLKRRRTDRGESSTSVSDETSANISPLPPQRHASDSQNEDVNVETIEVKNGESIAALRKMVLEKVEYKIGPQTAPGKYLALDCEMVGVGIEGNESSLARVSIVNYTGAIILDVFVRQRERVVDYRTQWSGVRSSDLAGSAKPFKEVQQTVAELIKDRILVGHAIYNDLKALLLSHPSPQVRDTQSLAYKHRVVKSRRPALRVLVKQELGIVIQGGEHSSVTDARATMALFRLYKKEWESGFRTSQTLAHSNTKNKNPESKTTVLPRSSPSTWQSIAHGMKRGRSELSKLNDGNDMDEVGGVPSPSSLTSHSPAPSGVSPISTQHTSTPLIRHKQISRSPPSVNLAHRKGISLGISTVTKRADGIKALRRQASQIGNDAVNSSKGGRMGKVGEKWWKTLGRDKKGSIKP